MLVDRFANFIGPEPRRRYYLRRLGDNALRRCLEAPLPNRWWDWRTVPYLALDLETTGGDPARDDILSFGWVCLEGPEIRLATARHRLIRPRGDLNAVSVTIHRITDDRAAGGEALEAVLTEFLAALAGRVLIAHHSATETGFVDTACRAIFGAPCPVPVVDTLDLALREPETRPAGALRLGALRARHGLPRYPAHHALSDALAAAELFLAQASERAGDDRLPLARLLVR